LDLTPCSVIEIYQCFEGTSCFHLLGSRRRHVGKLCIRYGTGGRDVAVWLSHWEMRQAGGDGAE